MHLQMNSLPGKELLIEGAVLKEKEHIIKARPSQFNYKQVVKPRVFQSEKAKVTSNLSL